MSETPKTFQPSQHFTQFKLPKNFERRVGACPADQQAPNSRTETPGRSERGNRPGIWIFLGMVEGSRLTVSSSLSLRAWEGRLRRRPLSRTGNDGGDVCFEEFDRYRQKGSIALSAFSVSGCTSL